MKIEIEDVEYLKVVLGKYSNKALRLFSEDTEREDRNSFQRDYSRIMYSSSFRRLQGKMQFLAISSNNFDRNRLTHSFEVSQIARSIAEKINEKIKDPTIEIPLYVVEAASLAHDIGNPPFGHYGEKVLNKIALGKVEGPNIGGFEGNAQTLKILMDLERKVPNKPGLNLTWRTLLSVIKYNNKHVMNPKKFIYDDNYDTINKFILSKGIEVKPRTLEAQIMDISDEIAYAAHDLEDALSHRFFSIDEYLYEFKRSKYGKCNVAYKKLCDVVEKSREKARECREASSDTYNYFFKKELTSNIVYELVQDIGLVDVSPKFKEKTGTVNEKEIGYKTLGNLAEGLKVVSFNCLKRSDVVQLYEKQGEIILRKLVAVYMNQNYNSTYDLLPVQYRPTEDEMYDKSNIEKYLLRHVIDYVSGMMDSYAISSFQKFYGENALGRQYDEELFNSADKKIISQSSRIANIVMYKVNNLSNNILIKQNEDS